MDWDRRGAGGREVGGFYIDSRSLEESVHMGDVGWDDGGAF